MQNVLEIVLGLLITCLFYSAIPICAAVFCHTPISQKYYRTICIISIVEVALLFSFITVYAGFSWKASPAIIWGYISYRIGVSILSKHGMLTSEPKEDFNLLKNERVQKEKVKPAAEQVKQAQQETYYICPGCGTLVRTGEVCACGFRSEAQNFEENH